MFSANFNSEGRNLKLTQNHKKFGCGEESFSGVADYESAVQFFKFKIEA